MEQRLDTEGYTKPNCVRFISKNLSAYLSDWLPCCLCIWVSRSKESHTPRNLGRRFNNIKYPHTCKTRTSLRGSTRWPCRSECISRCLPNIKCRAIWVGIRCTWEVSPCMHSREGRTTKVAPLWWQVHQGLRMVILGPQEGPCHLHNAIYRDKGASMGRILKRISRRGR